jgi:hypothetical protein
MSPNSSISSSDVARYFGVALLTAMVLVSIVAGISLVGIRRGIVTWEDGKILSYQLHKIAVAQRVDVLLVGDSTLGNAVDAQTWRGELGEAVLSVPLTGTYGYGGSLNMLRRVLRRHRPRVVVVFQSPDMMTRTIAYDGLLYTSETLGDIRGIPAWRLLGPLATWDIPMSMLANALTRHPPPGQGIKGDYVRQLDPAAARANVLRDAKFLTPTMIRPEKATYLREIGALCAREGIQCLYAHGPYVEPQCSSIGPYLRAVDTLVRASGLSVVPGTPVCMPLDEAGDAADHPAPALKQRYSETYLSLIEPSVSSQAVAQADGPSAFTHWRPAAAR